MSHLITNGVESQARLYTLDRVFTWQDHRDLVYALLDACDECLLVSPFLAPDFTLLLSRRELVGTTVELISSCAARGDDQFIKPYSLRSFGQTVRNNAGVWPTIGLDQKLHSKVYVFRLRGRPFAGIVTSANLTESGLRKNHETGVLLQSEETLTQLETMCRRSIDYVSLAEWQIDKLCQTADTIRRNYEPGGDREIGLKSILNHYATPSAGNRETTLRRSASYYIKVSGVRNRPILPEHRIVISEPHCRLTFAKEPKGISLGDCLLEVAVGGACFLSYYACASAAWEFSEKEKAVNSDHERWPYYVYANNLSLHYGASWYESPIFYDQVVSDYKQEHPNAPVTAAGADHFKGAMQMGHSYIKVTNTFGEYVRRRIDSYGANKSIQRSRETAGR